MTKPQKALSCLLVILGLPLSNPAEEPHKFGSTPCEGDYQHHLQGVCTDEKNSLYWSFTTELVKTNPSGKIEKKIPVVNHHGDLCYDDGKIYVAVNLGQFNNPRGNADSWVYVYDAETLREISRHEIQEVFHGAGGMDVKDGHFFVVGGLPEGVEENYVYEYDSSFTFIKKHIIPSGWTRLGIQTAAWHDSAWWFGCYGTPRILLKTDSDFNMLGRFEFDCGFGIVGIAPETFLIARGTYQNKRSLGTVHLAKPDKEKGLVVEPDQ